MSSGKKLTINKEACYFLTLTVVGWVDIFTRENHRKVIIDSLNYCIKEKGLRVHAYCLMPSHLHLIVSPETDVDLSDILRDFKRHTSMQIHQKIQEEPESRREWMLNMFEFIGKNQSKAQSFKLWKTGNHAFELYTPKFLWDKINYIHNNPVLDGFVERPEHLIYSSAIDYIENREGLIPNLTCIDPIQQVVN